MKINDDDVLILDPYDIDLLVNALSYYLDFYYHFLVQSQLDHDTTYDYLSILLKFFSSVLHLNKNTNVGYYTLDCLKIYHSQID